MSVLFGVIGISFSVVDIVKVVHLPAVVLSMLLGTVAGEVINLEKGLVRLGAMLEGITRRFFKEVAGNHQNNTAIMVSVLVMFCFTGTGIYGAMYAGISGGHSLLFYKAMADFVVFGLFAVRLGYVMMAVAIPQLECFLMLFYLVCLVLPIISESMLMGFTTCGEILMLATGVRIAKIKDYHIGNMLPSFIWMISLLAVWTIIAGT